MCVNSLPKTVTRQRPDCDLNPGPFAPESSTLTTWLPSHAIPKKTLEHVLWGIFLTFLPARRYASACTSYSPASGHRASN